MPELGGLVTFPIAEPSSALAFQDLIIEVAYKIGCAFYGADGQGAPQVPTDSHDLTICQRIVNKAIRKFINDGPPPNGWSWLTPVAQVDIWAQVNADTSGKTSHLTSTSSTSTASQGVLTTLTLALGAGSTSSTGIFYPSMELKTIWLGGNPPSGTPGFLSTVGQSTSTIGTPFTVVNYISSTQIQISGTPSTSLFSTGSTSWSMIADGDYTLPADFSGQYLGEPTYIANTNRGMTLHWTTEAMIRQRRQNYNIETGTPYQLAVRLMPTPSITPTAPGQIPLAYAPSRRRWQLMTWRITSENLHVLFKYTLGFQSLVNLTDSPPCPFAHDEALKACCLAVAEKEVMDQIGGPDWTYYHTDALRASWRIDAMNAPKKLGYNGNPRAKATSLAPIEEFRDFWMQRPTVPVNL